MESSGERLIVLSASSAPDGHVQSLEKLIGGINSTKQITVHWNEVLRPASSIQRGAVTALLMLSAYPWVTGAAKEAFEIANCNPIKIGFAPRRTISYKRRSDPILAVGDGGCGK
jgi:hypothetical protein